MPNQTLNQNERNRWASDDAGRMDAELNRVYQRLVAALASKPTALAALKKAQNAWLAFRDSEKEAVGAAFGDGSSQPEVVQGSVARLTRERSMGLLLALAAVSGSAKAVLGDGDDLPAADALLNRLWQAGPEADGDTRSRLAQRRWLTFRDAEASFWALLPGNATSVRTAVRARLTWERARALDGR